mgnify:CR=1 FL=1
MSMAERHPVAVKGKISYHKAAIPNPMGEPGVSNENAKLTLHIAPEKQLTDQPFARVPHHPYTVTGDNAQEAYRKLLMTDQLSTDSSVTITYDSSQPVPKAGEGWVMDSISVQNGEEVVVLDFKTPTNKGSN